MYERKNYYYDPSGGYYTSGHNGGQTGYSRSSGFTMNSGPDEPQDQFRGRSARSPKHNKAKNVIEWTKTKLACLLLAVVLLAGGAGYGGSLLAGGGSSQTSTTDSTVSNAGFDLESATGSSMTVQEITSAVSDSVVEIRTESVSQGQGMWVQEYVTEGAGSGVIISEDGYIVTNNHVVSGASSVYVTLDDSDKEYTAKVIGTDSANDIAVLKIDASGLTAAKFGDSDKLAAGDMAVVIGNPLGELGDSVSAGIISSTARKITLENQEMTLIQTDASINPGNSGGGMFSSSGQLIGIVVAKSSGTDIEGLGFAIPINTVSKSIDKIMNGEGDDTSDTQDQQSGQDSGSQDSQDQYGSGQDQYGSGQDQYGSDPFSSDPFGSDESIFDYFGF